MSQEGASRDDRDGSADGQGEPEQQPGGESAPPARPATWWLWGRRAIELVAAVALGMWGWGVAQDLLDSEPKAKRKRGGPRAATLVEVVEAGRYDGPVSVKVSGVVVPARQVDVSAQIPGVVASLEQALDPGDIVRGDEAIAKLDPRDYRLAVQRARAAVDQAKADLALEAGNQRIAKAELELLRDSVEVDESLILRKPQLAVVEATLKSAKAALADARLDLDRTTIVAPWTGQVAERHVDVGSPVGSNTPIVSLIGTDTWWVEAQVPLDKLKWLDLPERDGTAPGSTALVHLPSAWAAGVTRVGELRQSRPGVEARGRMAQLLVAIDDPLSLDAAHTGEPELVLGAWATIDIQGTTLENVVPVPRELVRDGQTLWVMNDAGELEVRELEIAFDGGDEVLVGSGVAPGEQIIVTQLPVAVPGMKVRVEDGAPPEEGGKGGGKGKQDAGEGEAGKGGKPATNASPGQRGPRGGRVDAGGAR